MIQLLNKDVLRNIFSRALQHLLCYHQTMIFFPQHELLNKRRLLKRLRSDKRRQEEIALKIIVWQSLCSFFVEALAFATKK